MKNFDIDRATFYLLQLLYYIYRPQNVEVNELKGKKAHYETARTVFFRVFARVFLDAMSSCDTYGRTNGLLSMGMIWMQVFVP
jgi:hypothetical protein